MSNQTTSAVRNILFLCVSSYNPNNMTPTARMSSCFSKVACINQQEVHDRYIAAELCNMRLCAVVRMERIARHCHALLAGEEVI